MSVMIRKPEKNDRQKLAELLQDTAAFTREEVACALELIDQCLNDPEQKDYHILVAEDAGQLAGYACYGPVPLTKGTFDLYWIAVLPGRKRTGTGALLLQSVEDDAKRAHARMLLIQTSGRPDYAGVRSFYGRNGYREAARIADYYAPGDDGIIFRKQL